MNRTGPFGLYMGMPLSEIPYKYTEMENNDYMFEILPKSHSSFDYYMLKIIPGIGLVRINAYSHKIACSSDGREIREEFNVLRNRLTKKYGSSDLFDTEFADDQLLPSESWIMSLYNGEVVLASVWERNIGSHLDFSIYRIMLSAIADTQESGMLYAQYDFENDLENTEMPLEPQDQDVFL